MLYKSPRAGRGEICIFKEGGNLTGGRSKKRRKKEIIKKTHQALKSKPWLIPSQGWEVACGADEQGKVGWEGKPAPGMGMCLLLIHLFSGKHPEIKVGWLLCPDGATSACTGDFQACLL